MSVILISHFNGLAWLHCHFLFRVFVFESEKKDEDLLKILFRKIFTMLFILEKNNLLEVLPSKDHIYASDIHMRCVCMAQAEWVTRGRVWLIASAVAQR